MSEESSPPNLAAIDLSLSFAPAWAKEGDSNDRLAKLAARHDREERPDRFGRGDRPERGGGVRGDRRPPRRDGGGGAGGAKSDRSRGDRKGGRRDRDERAEARPPRAPEPEITGWEIRFLPDRHGVEGLAKQIRSTARAYPLFDLARLILEKSERYLVEFKRKDESATPLFQLKADGTLWLSESEAVARALSAQIDAFYRRERVAVDPPKGNYAFVAVCGMSGTVLGPPNYHDYQTKLVRLHAERFASMPFEAFKAKIRMERGEEVIAKWREEQSFRDVFFPLPPAPPAGEAAPAPESVGEVPPVPEAAEAPAVAPDDTVGPPAVEGVAPETELATSAPEEPTDAPAENAAGAEEAPVAAEVAPEESAPDPAPADATPEVRLESLAEVAEHFRAHYAAKAVVRIRERVLAPGSAALNDSAAPVLRLTRRLWDELDRFPLPLAHTLGQQLAGRGLQLFKAHENLTYVSVARPKYLDYSATAVSAGVRAILEYLESHAKTPRPDQWKALLAARPESEDDRETALLTDLRWLLLEGHVVDFAKRNLEVARKPKPQPVKAAPKPARPAPTAGAGAGAAASPKETPPEAAAVEEETAGEATALSDLPAESASLAEGEIQETRESVAPGAHPAEAETPAALDSAPAPASDPAQGSLADATPGIPAAETAALPELADSVPEVAPLPEGLATATETPAPPEGDPSLPPATTPELADGIAAAPVAETVVPPSTETIPPAGEPSDAPDAETTRDDRA